MEGRGGDRRLRPRQRPSSRTTSAWQGARMTRFALASLLQMPVHHVNVVNGDIGGSFGQKTFVRSRGRVDLAWPAEAARPAGQVDRGPQREPDRLPGTRARRPLDVEAAVDDDGTILGVRVKVVLDQGAYPIPSRPVDAVHRRHARHVPGRVPDPRPRVRRHDRRSRTRRRTARTAARGRSRRGSASGCSTASPTSSASTRSRSAAATCSATTRCRAPMVTGPTLSGITVRSALDKAERVAGYADFRAEQARAREPRAGYLGLGVATFIEAAPGPPDYGPAIGFAVPPERATARLEADGTLTVHTAQAPHGQSHETTLAQVAADDARRAHVDPCGWCTATAAPRPFSHDGHRRQPRRDGRDGRGARRDARDPQPGRRGRCPPVRGQPRRHRRSSTAWPRCAARRASPCPSRRWR